MNGFASNPRPDTAGIILLHGQNVQLAAVCGVFCLCRPIRPRLDSQNWPCNVTSSVSVRSMTSRDLPDALYRQLNEQHSLHEPSQQVYSVTLCLHNSCPQTGQKRTRKKAPKPYAFITRDKRPVMVRSLFILRTANIGQP